jgi:hypothetical protein
MKFLPLIFHRKKMLQFISVQLSLRFVIYTSRVGTSSSSLLAATTDETTEEGTWHLHFYSEPGVEAWYSEMVQQHARKCKTIMQRKLFLL